MKKETCTSMYGSGYCTDPQHKDNSDFCCYCLVLGYTWEKYKKEILNETTN